MDVSATAAAIGSGLMSGALGALIPTLASFAFVALASLLPVYVAVYRRCLRRAFVLLWVVLVADLGLLGMPPFGAALWLAALAYAFLPRRRRAPPKIRKPIAARA